LPSKGTSKFDNNSRWGRVTCQRWPKTSNGGGELDGQRHNNGGVTVICVPPSIQYPRTQIPSDMYIAVPRSLVICVPWEGDTNIPRVSLAESPKRQSIRKKTVGRREKEGMNNLVI
jgi:hypothetical protein